VKGGEVWPVLLALKCNFNMGNEKEGGKRGTVGGKTTWENWGNVGKAAYTHL